MIGSIIAQILSWIEERALDMFTLLQAVVSDLFSTNLSVFNEIFGIEVVSDIIVAFGFGLMFIIVAFQLFRCIAGPLAEAQDEPWKLVVRMCIAIFLMFNFEQIGNLILELATFPSAWFANTYSNLAEMEEAASSSGGGWLSDFFGFIGNLLKGAAEVLFAWLVPFGGVIEIGIHAIFGNSDGGNDYSELVSNQDITISDDIVFLLLSCILFIALMYEYIKFLIGMAERYVTVGVLLYTAPLAIALMPSKSTSRSFNSWIRMLGTQIFILVMNSLFLSMIGYALGHIGDYSTNIPSNSVYLLFMIGFLHVASKLESILGLLGLNAAPLTSTAADLMMGMRGFTQGLGYLQRGVSTLSRVATSGMGGPGGTTMGGDIPVDDVPPGGSSGSIEDGTEGIGASESQQGLGTYATNMNDADDAAAKDADHVISAGGRIGKDGPEVSADGSFVMGGDDSESGEGSDGNDFEGSADAENTVLDADINAYPGDNKENSNSNEGKNSESSDKSNAERAKAENVQNTVLRADDTPNPEEKLNEEKNEGDGSSGDGTVGEEGVAASRDTTNLVNNDNPNTEKIDEETPRVNGEEANDDGDIFTQGATESPESAKLRTGDAARQSDAENIEDDMRRTGRSYGSGGRRNSEEVPHLRNRGQSGPETIDDPHDSSSFNTSHVPPSSNAGYSGQGGSEDIYNYSAGNRIGDYGNESPSPAPGSSGESPHGGSSGENSSRVTVESFGSGSSGGGSGGRPYEQYQGGGGSEQQSQMNYRPPETPPPAGTYEPPSEYGSPYRSNEGGSYGGNNVGGSYSGGSSGGNYSGGSDVGDYSGNYRSNGNYDSGSHSGGNSNGGGRSRKRSSPENSASQNDIPSYGSYRNSNSGNAGSPSGQERTGGRSQDPDTSTLHNKNPNESL